MPYRHLDLSISDVAFSAWGNTVEQMFLAATEATLSLMLEKPEAVGKKESVRIQLKEKNIEMLMFNYLQELVFYKDTRQLLLKAAELTVHKGKGNFILKGTLAGEKINPKKHNLHVDIKAVTLYKFRVEAKNNKWQTTVVLDV